MRVKHIVAVAAVFALYAGALSGCGLFPDSSQDTTTTSTETTAPATSTTDTTETTDLSSSLSSFALAPRVTGLAAPLELAFIPSALAPSVAFGLYVYTIQPDVGPLPGGTAVTISGNFPVSATLSTVASASAAYTVYFDYVPASFDPAAVPNVVTATEMHVISPPGAALGPVDVLVQDDFTPSNFANVHNGFTYVDPASQLNILQIVPDSGPLAGGNPAVLLGAFNVSVTLDTVKAASDAYVVYIGGNVAPFDPAFAPSIVTSSEMHIIVPPGAAPGLVDVEVRDVNNPTFSDVLVNGYEYFNPIIIDTIAPDCGPVRGGTEVDITFFSPVLPTIATAKAAESVYAVYFGGNRAPFNPGVPNVVTSNSMHVIAPAAAGPGFVDVTVFDIGDPNNFDVAVNGFSYVPNIELTLVAPAVGPDGGGAVVTLTGTFLAPSSPAINTVAAAAAAYTVFFDFGNAATFDAGAAPNIVTQTEMHVITPAHVPGFVDVWVVDAVCPSNFARLNLGYEYVTGVGNWTDVVFIDNQPPIGPVDAGELKIQVVTAGTVDDLFVVPQGGNPADNLDRIDFTFDGTNWVNDSPIRTLVRDLDSSGGISDGDLFADGHAAVYLVSNGVITGDNAADLSDGGVIQLAALTKRHFLIDTVPPVLRPDPANNTAFNFVQINEAGEYRPLGVGMPSAAHPYNPTPAPPSGLAQVDFNFPQDAGTIGLLPGLSGGARIFVNTESISNLTGGGDLDLTVGVAANGLPLPGVHFFDESVHEAYGLSLSPRDVDFFDPAVTTRQVGGFEAAPVPAPASGTVDAILFNGPHAQWVLAPGSDAPNPPAAPANDVVPTYSTDPADTDTGFVEIADTRRSLYVEWPITGLSVFPPTGTLHLALQFRAHDQAGRWLDRNGNVKTNFTGPERLRDPLHLWWLRQTESRTFPDREGSEVYLPVFTFSIDRPVNPNAENVGPLYSFRLFRASETGKGAYNPDPLAVPPIVYEALPISAAPLDDWSAWSLDDRLDSTDVDFTIPELVNRWVLLVVASIDEAGNVERWPVELTLVGTDITDIAGHARRNWQRFYVLGEPQGIETSVSARFWHNNWNVIPPPPGDLTANPDDIFEGVSPINFGEIDFGDRTIIPLPPKNLFDPLDPLADPADPSITIDDQRVEAQFTFEVQAEGANSIDVEWELFVDGQQTALDQGRLIGVAPGTNSVTLPVGSPVVTPDYLLGDPERLRPITYVFRATTIALDDALPTPNEIGRDSTPAEISFTIVPSVEGFVDDRDSPDEQPIRIFERQ